MSVLLTHLLHPKFALLVILLSGALLRFYALERQSLWDDEMSTLHQISAPSSQWLHRFRTYETHPPLYFMQLAIWKHFLGHSLGTLRANSALWGSLTLWLFYLLAKAYIGPWGAFLATALMSFSPFHLAYSQELRPYAMAIALAIGGFLALEYCLRFPSPPPSPARGEGEEKALQINSLSPTWERAGVRGEFSQWYLLGMIWVMELYTHYWGFFVVTSQALYGFYRTKADKRKKRKLLITGLIAFSLFLLWLPILFDQLHAIKKLDFGFWVPAPSLLNLGKTFFAFTGTFFRFASSTFHLPGPWVFKIAVAMAYGVTLIMGLIKTTQAPGKVWLLVGLGVPFLLSFWNRSIYVWYRYPSLIYPAFVMVVMAGARSWRRPVWPILLLTIFLVSSGWGCWVYFHRWQKANPKDVVAYIHARKTPTTIVVRPSYFSDLFAYYDHPQTPTIDEHSLDSPEARSRLNGKTFFLVAFDAPNDSIKEALLSEFQIRSSQYFPAHSHLGITVYELKN